MTKPSRDDFERVRDRIAHNWQFIDSHSPDDAIILEALRIAADQMTEREKVVAYINALIEALPPIYDGERKILSRVVMDIERGDHSTATPVSGWRSMDSAPRDGTRVLLWYEELEPHTIQGQWDADFGWVDVWNNDKIEGDSGSIQPTHWQPLPSPPGGGT